MAAQISKQKIADAARQIAALSQQIRDLEIENVHYFRAICDLLGVEKGGRVRVINRKMNGVCRHHLYTIHPSKKCGALLKTENPVWGSAEQVRVDYQTLAAGLYDGQTYDRIVAALPTDTNGQPDTWTQCDVLAPHESDPAFGTVRTYAWVEIQEGELLHYTGNMGLCRLNNYTEAEARIHQTYPEIGRIHWVSTCEYELHFPGVQIPR